MFLYILGVFLLASSGFAEEKTDGAVANYKEMLAQHDTLIQQLLKRIQEQDKLIEELKQETIVKPQVNDPFAGFFAVQTGVQDVGPQAALKFETVKYNIAPPNYGYDGALGFFRTPYTGTYVFFVNIRTGSSGDSHSAAITVEEQTRAMAYSQPYSSHHNSASALLLVNLSRGQDVRVINPETSGLQRYSSTALGDTHFLGYRVN